LYYPQADDYRRYLGFAPAVVLSPVCVALLGILFERFLLRRFYTADPILSLLVTFGLAMVAEQLIRILWGAAPLSASMPTALKGSVIVGDFLFSRYRLLLLAVVAVVLAGVWLLLHKTSFGRVVRAGIQRPDMVAALGIRLQPYMTAVVMLGVGMAALGGAFSKTNPESVGKMLAGLSFVTFQANQTVWFGTTSTTSGKLFDGIQDIMNILVSVGDLDKDTLDGNPHTITNSRMLGSIVNSPDIEKLYREIVAPEKVFTPLPKERWEKLSENPIGTLVEEPIIFQRGTTEIVDESEEPLTDAVNKIIHYPRYRVVVQASVSQSDDPQADLQLAMVCPQCAHRWTTTFDIASFFWTELNAWALRLLREVHTLASVYGWSEAEILDLSPTRRKAYLEMNRP